LKASRTGPDFSAVRRLCATRNPHSSGMGIARTESGSKPISEAQPSFEASEAA